jgi:hypothetical protein
MMRKGTTMQVVREEIKGGRKKLREERRDRGENEMGGGGGHGCNTGMEDHRKRCEWRQEQRARRGEIGRAMRGEDDIGWGQGDHWNTWEGGTTEMMVATRKQGDNKGGRTKRALEGGCEG